MKSLTLIFSLFIILSLQAQQEVTAIKAETSSPKQQNIIKIGFSIRGELYYNPFYDYDYYPSYQQEYDDYESGYNVPVFVSFEHIWEMKNQIAMSIEPMLGVSFRRNLTSFLAGAEFKCYWANNGWWRMGISFNTAYTYGTTNTTRWVGMDNGNYQQLKDMKVHYNIVSFDPGIVPFQFHIKNSPVVIESMFSLIGLNLITRTTERIPVDDDTELRISSFDVRPYLFKFELKVGIILP